MGTNVPPTVKSPNVENSTFFRDGISKIDFILVQREDKPQAKRLQNYQFVNNLKRFGIRVEREKGIKYKNLVFVKLHAPDKVLKNIADIHKVTLTYENDRTIPDYRRRWTFFKTPITKKPNLQDPLFRRCSESVRGEPNRTYTSAERIMLVYYLLLRTSYGKLQNEYGLPSLLDKKNFDDAYPLHEGKWEWDYQGTLNDRQILVKFWANWKNFYKQQPIHIVYKYFGSEIAFHYAWLEFYTKLLLPMAILGIAIFIYRLFSVFFFPESLERPRINDVCNSDTYICPQCTHNECILQKMDSFCKDAMATYVLDNMYTMIFAMLIGIWATLYLQFWNRTEVQLMFKWNLLNMAPDIDERPHFIQETKNYVRTNRVTGAEEHYYPIKFKILRYAASTIVCLVCIALLLATVLLVEFSVFVLDYYMHASTESEFIENYGTWLIEIYSGIASLVIVTICSGWISKIAQKLTDKERHRTNNEYLNSFIFKSYLISFFNSYTRPMYDAFFQSINYTSPGDQEKYEGYFGIGSTVCPPSIGCTFSLSIAVFIIMLKGFILLLVTKGSTFRMFIRKVKNICKSKRKRTIVEVDQPLPQWELDYELMKADDMFFLDSFMSTVLEYGMVIFFVGAMPLLPFLAAFINIIGLRISAKTLVKHIRRNVPKRVNGLGAWNVVLISVTRLSLIISGCVVAFTSKFVHRMVYLTEHASLEGFVDDTISEFLVDDFGPKVKKDIMEKFPNVTSCYFAGLRNPPNHTEKYEASDRFYQIISIQLIAAVLFSHIIYFLSTAISVRIPEMSTEIREQVVYDRDKKLTKSFRGMDTEDA